VILLRGEDGEHAVLHELGGTGPNLLLTHGNGLNTGMWAATIPYLLPHFCCYGLDFRGHGRSQVQSHPLNVERSFLIEEVHMAVEALGGGPIYAVGHSLGGATLLKAEVDRPNSFSNLWLFEPVLVPPGRPRLDENHPLILASRRRKTEFKSKEEIVNRLMTKLPFSQCEKLTVESYIDFGTVTTKDGVRLSCSGDTEANIFMSGTPTDFKTLETVHSRIVVARGEKIAAGNEIPPAMAEPIAEALAHASLLPMHDMTHFGPLEDGKRVAEAILKHFVRH
jgi:pimeloyl-ACP methyl ester carboxylesterase|tara:strand:+ start:22999 stop:23838 length:840 start_codon:yes stop_codon:yes gene_type:complete